VRGHKADPSLFIRTLCHIGKKSHGVFFILPEVSRILVGGSSEDCCRLACNGILTEGSGDYLAYRLNVALFIAPWVRNFSGCLRSYVDIRDARNHEGAPGIGSGSSEALKLRGRGPGFSFVSSSAWVSLYWIG
jgi:hypothetical protein